jgi:septal ring factor EnvC (AmiA/AmiB activator)
MSDLITQILLGLVAVGFFSDLAKGFFQKKKINSEAKLDDANAVQVIVGTAASMLEPLSKRLKEAEEEVTNLRKELREARSEAAQLVSQLQASTAENKRVTAENRKLRLKLSGGAA